MAAEAGETEESGGEPGEADEGAAGQQSEDDSGGGNGRGAKRRDRHGIGDGRIDWRGEGEDFLLPGAHGGKEEAGGEKELPVGEADAGQAQAHEPGDERG